MKRLVMMCEDCIFLKNNEYCMLFEEKNDGQHKHWWCKVRPPMTSDKLIEKIKEDIENFFEVLECGLKQLDIRI